MERHSILSDVPEGYETRTIHYQELSENMFLIFNITGTNIHELLVRLYFYLLT